MGRHATKAVGNVWYQARIEAAKYNERLSSRMGAAEEAGMSEDAIKNTELGIEKCMPVDKAVILADLYKAPNLLNYYCKNECPIGSMMPISDSVLPIEMVTVKLLKSLRVDRLEELKNKLVDISEDGVVDQTEMGDLIEVQDYLNELMKVITELRTIVGKLS